MVNDIIMFACAWNKLDQESGLHSGHPTRSRAEIGRKMGFGGPGTTLR